MNNINPDGCDEYDGDTHDTADDCCPHGVSWEDDCEACYKEQMAELRGHADLFDPGIPKD